MANKQIYQLTQKPTPLADTDQFAIDDASHDTWKVTATDLQTYTVNSLTTVDLEVASLGIGAPAVAGSAVNVSGSFNIGAKTSNTVSNFASTGFWVDTTFTADNGISTGHVSFLANENINVVTSIASAVSFEAHATILGGANITNAYGYFYAAPTVSGGTTATNAYGGYFQNPGSFATNKTALYAADASIGYTGVSPPSGGLCVSGSTTIGTSTPNVSALLTMSSTTQGFLPTRMTTVQRDAIASTATGLTLYNTTTSDLEFYNGSAWIGASKSGVTSVSGTSNRITVSPTTGDAIVDISASYVGQSSITTLGTITTGAWNGTLVSSQYGGTGVNNGSNTLTLAGSLATAGAFGATFTFTNTTAVTFPVSGTLATTAGTVSTLTGTASQVLINGGLGPTSGAITLTLPQNINTSATFQVGTLSVGTTAISSTSLSIAQTSQYALKAQASLSSGNASNITSNLTYTQSSGTLDLYSFSCTDYVTVSGSSAISNLVGYRVAHSLNTASTVTTYRGFWGKALTSGAGTNITNAYTAYFENPDITGNVVSTNKTALYADDAAIGFTGVSAPASGLCVSGRALFGTSTLPGGTSASQVTLGGTTRSEMIFRASSGGTDMKTWSFGCNTTTTNNQFIGFTWNDAYTSTANWLTVQRNTNNYTIQLINFPNGNTMFGSTSAAVSKVDISGNVSIGSFAGVSAATTNGLAVSGNVGIGNIGSTTVGLFLEKTLTTTTPSSTLYSHYNNGVFTFNSGATGAASTTLFINNTLAVSSGATSIGQFGIFINPLTSSGAGTLPPNSYGILAYKPTGGTSTNMAIYGDNLAIGSSNITVQPPANGILTQAFQMNTSPAANYVLTSDASGNGTWQQTNATPSGLQSWTPSISFGGGTTGITYTTHTGTYSVCGKIVFFAGYVLLSSKGSSTGAGKLTGLPVTSSSTANSPATFTILFTNLGAAGVQTCGTVTNSVTTADLVDNNGGGTVTIDDTDFTNTTSMTFSGFYYTD